MTEQSEGIKATDPWAGTGPVQGLRQIANLIQAKYGPMVIHVSANGRTFESVEGADSRKGVCSVRGDLVDDSVIMVKAEMVRAPRNVRVPMDALFTHLSQLDDKYRINAPTQDPNTGETVLSIMLRVRATPLSLSRESALLLELEKLDALANALRAELPNAPAAGDLAKLYEKFTEALEPIHPWQPLGSECDPRLDDWARETLDFIEGSASVAISADCPIAERFVLALLARSASEFDRTLGRLVLPAINTKGLMELVTKAPGIVAVPVVRMSLGSNPYDLGNEMEALLSALSSSGHPALFTGTQAQLQSVLAGGQGAANDPLHPVLRHAPGVAISALARFGIRTVAMHHGGLPVAAEEALVAETLKALKRYGPATQKRVLPMVSARAFAAWQKGGKGKRDDTAAFTARVQGLTETLAGLSPKARAARSADVQERYVQTLTAPSLMDYLRGNLLAQEMALEQLAVRLRTECLTRPLHQPLRYCAQGTPATGKSESAILLAARLSIPYVNIDAASMPDYYTAAAQLLGSGRGIVGSFKSGRLEEAAKHHLGALIEVSDLDHAVPTVRSALADLFLQILETGEGQSATGAVFSCANLILAFTMNLPDGMDETVRNRIGYNSTPSRQEIGQHVAAEIKQMLSGAFLSRIGTPIVFEPLDGAALAQIVERAIKAAVASAAQQTGVGIKGVILDADVGAQVVANVDANITSFGARVLLEQGRSLAAEAFLELIRTTPSLSDVALRVSADAGGRLKIEPV